MGHSSNVKIVHANFVISVEKANFSTVFLGHFGHA